MNNQIYAALLPDSQAHTPRARQSTTTDNPGGACKTTTAPATIPGPPVPPPVCGARITAPQPNGRCPGLPPTGAHDAYQTGEYMIWTDGQTYRCTTDNTVWGPDTLPSAWEVV